MVRMGTDGARRATTVVSLLGLVPLERPAITAAAAAAAAAATIGYNTLAQAEKEHERDGEAGGRV